MYICVSSYAALQSSPVSLPPFKSVVLLGEVLLRKVHTRHALVSTLIVKMPDLEGNATLNQR